MAAPGLRNAAASLDRHPTKPHEVWLGKQLPPISPTFARAFWKRVQRTAGCWWWRGTLTAQGYGRATVRSRRESQTNRQELAHRVAWTLTYGPLPPDLFVLHRCDEPACVNPQHLRLGTHAENQADKLAKGRQVGANSYKTHCIRGHAFDAENTYVNPQGKRTCRACLRTVHAERQSGRVA